MTLVDARARLAAGLAGALAIGLFAGTVAAGETPPGAGGEAGTPVLDLDRGSLRAFLQWKTPALLGADGRMTPLLEPAGKNLKDEDRRPWPVAASSEPAEGWREPGFDDSSWPRVRGAIVAGGRHDGGLTDPGNPGEWRLLCLRGKFRVTAPHLVKGLRIQVRYHGGAVVSVNGAEVARGSFGPNEAQRSSSDKGFRGRGARAGLGPRKPGRLDRDTLAEPYPDEAYLRPDGKRYAERDEKAFADRMKVRERILPSKGDAGWVEIPGSLLREGVNVVAVELRAAAIRAIAVSAPPAVAATTSANLQWPHVALLELRVIADSPAGLLPNAGPSPAVAVWNCQPVETVAVWDFPDPVEKPFPIRIVGARNGALSGKVVLSSAQGISGLKATCSDLAAEKGTGRIPASAVQVRRAEPAVPTESWVGQDRFDRLTADFPGEIAPVSVNLRGAAMQPAPAAVVPVWVTVRVPADAAPGAYSGTLTIEAQAAERAVVSVPVHLTVHDWTLPNPRDFATRHHLYESPETVALYYKVPLWSERHWELVGQSVEVLGQVANKICVANLVVKVPNLGNAESMVRWVRQADGSYAYDFSILERYLDVYAAKAGKPGLLCLNVWAHFSTREGDGGVEPPRPVTVVDAAGTKLEDLAQPPYGTPENEAFWRPVLTELRSRLEGRGWFDVTAIAYASYCWAPTPEMVDVYHHIWPDGRWMNSSHGNPTQFKGTTVSMPVPWRESVWGVGRLYSPELASHYPTDRYLAKEFPGAWQDGPYNVRLGNPRVGTGFISRLMDRSPLIAYRAVTELSAQGGIQGLGRVGGDFWPLPTRDPRGRLVPMCDAKYAIGPNNNVISLTCPGPDGAVFNERLEMFREGVQVAEAIISLQRAAASGKLAPGLLERIKQLLDERARCNLRTRPGTEVNWWSLECSGWQERDDQLFALAAEAGASR